MIRQLLPALIWNYKSTDMQYLVKCDLINTLQYGDGGRIHPIPLSWGKQIKQVKQSNNKSLTRSIANLFEFIFKQVLSQVILIDTSVGEDAGQNAQILPTD